MVAALLVLALALRLGAAGATWNLPLRSDPSDYDRHAVLAEQGVHAIRVGEQRVVVRGAAAEVLVLTGRALHHGEVLDIGLEHIRPGGRAGARAFPEGKGGERRSDDDNSSAAEDTVWTLRVACSVAFATAPERSLVSLAVSAIDVDVDSSSAV